MVNMVSVPKLKQLHIWLLLLLLIAADGLVLAEASITLSYGSALILLTFLPGWVWSQIFLIRPMSIIERIILAIGLSLALAIFGAMFAVYLPGSLTVNQLLITINAITITGLLLSWQFKDRNKTRLLHPAPSTQPQLLLTAILLLILAAALRLPHLAYAEFHEDEAETLMLGVRLLQGEDYALFLHRKGPAQMLMPVAFWLLTGRITEALARFPFALSSVLSVITLFYIGRRWFNWPAGLVAGLLWAINGYAIGFGRMVQYQALIFFLGPLALYCLYLAWKDRQPRLQILGAILLAASLLAHFDALLLLPAAGYLLSRKVDERHFVYKNGGENKSSPPHPRTPAPPHPRLVTPTIALTLFLALLASFYIPFILDPEFQNTANYLTGSRVKPGFLYNNLDLLRRLDRDYSSRFYLSTLALGIVGYIGLQSVILQKKWRWLIAGLVLLAATAFWQPKFWQVGPLNLGLLPWLGLLSFSFWFTSSVEVRATWILFGAALIGYVFLVEDPRTHLYILYPGAVLVAGAGWARLVGVETKSPLRFSPLIIGLLLVGATIVYVRAIFLQTESAFTQLRSRWDGSAWEVIYDSLPRAREYFGYPKREGWKAIGALRAQGHFPGDFRSAGEDFIIPIWYNYGQARSCYNTPAHVFVRAAADDNIPILGEQYVEVSQVQRESEIRLRIFSAGLKPKTRPNSYAVEQFLGAFDRLATPEQFTQQAEPSQFVGTQFGPAITFVGYDLPATSIMAGDTLHLNLYWQALQNPGKDYRAFVHLTDGTKLWSQQDDNPACRLPTSIWRTGQRGLGQFRLPINPETPPGRYPLIIGLYEADTLKRLKVTTGAGQLGDDFLWLGDIEVASSK
jgi:hypothetical protein